MVGRRILVPEVGVRVPVPQLVCVAPARGLFVVRHDNACDSESKDFVRISLPVRVSIATVPTARDTSGPLSCGAVSPVPEMEVRPENPSDGCVRPDSVDPAGDGTVTIRCRSRRATDAPPELHQERPAGAPLLRSPRLVAERPAVCDRGEEAVTTPYIEPHSDAARCCRGNPVLCLESMGWGWRTDSVDCMALLLILTLLGVGAPLN